jgi:hypothetical protein
MGDGSWPGQTSRQIDTDHREVYLSFWYWLDPAWDGHQSGVNKILYLWIDGAPKVFLDAHGTEGNPLTPQVDLQNLDVHPGGGARNLSPNLVPSIRVERGKWHHWELLIRANTPGMPDGHAQLWIDGTKVLEYSDLGLVGPGDENRWETIQYGPVWGGRGDVLLATQYARLDHLYLSGGQR